MRKADDVQSAVSRPTNTREDMKRLILAGAAALALSGCASIISGTTQTVTLRTEPTAANIEVINRAGDRVHSGTSPMTVSLKRGAGYFKSEQYTVRFTKEGYAPKEVQIVGTVNGWYVANILFGGLIGMLAVDPATGAMYSLDPSDLNAQLEATGTPQAKAGDTLKIVSTTDLTAEQMKQAKPLQ